MPLRSLQGPPQAGVDLPAAEPDLGGRGRSGGRGNHGAVPLPQRPLRVHGDVERRSPPVEELLRRARHADRFHPVVHRDDRLRRHLLLHRRDGARGVEGERQGTPHRVAPHDR